MGCADWPTDSTEADTSASQVFHGRHLDQEQSIYIIASHLHVDKWHAYLGEPTPADAILDRKVHHRRRIELQVPGGSMRKNPKAMGA